MTDCFRCGDPDHLSYDCPTRTPMRTAPVPAPGLTAAPDSNRPENKPIPEPVPVSQRAAYGEVAPWAEWVRETMGWHVRASEAAEIRSQAKAAEQVAESRAARHVMDS